MSRHNPRYNLVLALSQYFPGAHRAGVGPGEGGDVVHGRNILPHSDHRRQGMTTPCRRQSGDPRTHDNRRGVRLRRVTPAEAAETIHDDRLSSLRPLRAAGDRAAVGYDTSDHVGWEAQGWVGGDFNKFWWKTRARLSSPAPMKAKPKPTCFTPVWSTAFWNVQAGAQYANESRWGEFHEDRWSGVIALQGLAPYKFEIDNSLYISEGGDLILSSKEDVGIRVTQRLVIQPLAGAVIGGPGHSRARSRGGVYRCEPRPARSL